MFAQLLLGGLCFAASILTLLPHLLTEPAREIALGLLTAAVYLGAIAYAVRYHLDLNPPTKRTENRP